MLVGRDAETVATDRLLAAAREGRSGAIVVRGEAGVGKSALLEAAAGRAADFTVLRCSGVEVESEFTYAALHQILRPVFGRIERLPEPQAAALRGAFALSSETVDERFRVSVGVLGLLAEAAEERPLLCLIDDAQWLDQASADALLFAARRLEAEAIALIFAARDDSERPFVARGLPDLRPSALNPADSRRLLSEQFGRSVGPVALDWIVEHANGNPLALVELPAGLSPQQLAGQAPLAGKVPPATSVEQIYQERVATLPASTRRLLILAAADETGVRATVERAAESLGLDIADLAAAESAGLVRVDAEQLAFRHPLVRSAVYRGAAFTEREGAHRTLAVASSAAGNPDRAAWHRAAAAIGTDEGVARELEDTAGRAGLLSGHAAAASALERAAELSPDAGARARRLVAAAGAAWRAGLPDRATVLIDRASPIVSDDQQLAELDHIRGLIELRRGTLLDAGAILVSAAEKAATRQPRKALEMLVDAGSVAGRSGNFARMAEVGQRAAALPRSGDQIEDLLTDLLVGVGGFIEGKDASAVPLILQAIRRAGEFDDPRVLSWAAIGASTVGDEATEAALLRQAIETARASAAVDTLVLILETVVSSGIVSGHYSLDTEAAEGLRLARELGLPNAATAYLAALAWIAGLRGHDAQCRAYAEEAGQLSRVSGMANSNSTAEWAVALLDLSIGRPEQAAARLAALSTAPLGVSHPFFVLLSAPDLAEAYVRTERREQARAAFGVLVGFAQPGAPRWARALAARCRGMLASGTAAEHEFTEALRLHAQSNRPFDRARTQLLYGEFLRRGRRRSDARDQLRAALAAFEQLGAEPWAERARTELRATGETARKRDPSRLDALTPQELQIARLVAEGGSNKAVAAHLFLSPRTVEYHLAKVFTKLAITSRAELVRHGVNVGQSPSLAR